MLRRLQLGSSTEPVSFLSLWIWTTPCMVSRVTWSSLWASTLVAAHHAWPTLPVFPFTTGTLLRYYSRGGLCDLPRCSSPCRLLEACRRHCHLRLARGRALFASDPGPARAHDNRLLDNDIHLALYSPNLLSCGAHSAYGLDPQHVLFTVAPHAHSSMLQRLR